MRIELCLRLDLMASGPLGRRRLGGWAGSVSEPRAVATGSADCGMRISDFGFEFSNPQSAICNRLIRSLPLAVLTRRINDPVATARGSDTALLNHRIASKRDYRVTLFEFG